MNREMHELPSEWRWEYFTDILDIQGGTQPPSECFKDEPLDGYVRLVQIRDFETDAHITFIPATGNLKHCEEDDILIARYGASVGRICSGLSGAYNVALAKVVKTDSSTVTSYLRFLLRSEYFQQPLLASSGRSAQAGFNKGDLSVISLPIPPVPKQKAIAHILGTLDDKVELNRKTNETLEAMAKALFKSWFVDFDPVRAKAEGRPTGLPDQISELFPDSFEDSELGEIPRGWEVKAMDDVAHFLNGLALQKFPPQDGDPALPVIKITQLKKGDTQGADRCSAAVPGEYVIRDGDVLFSWSGSLAVDIWCGGEGVLNQHLFKVTSKTYQKWFVYQWVKHHLPDFQQIAQGKATTMGHIQRHHLSEAKALVPATSLLSTMDSAFTPLLERAFGLRRQLRELSSIRDALLPKLISGEIHIPDAEKMLEEVGV
jgi:type I restriction enzyme S subunit